MTVNRNSAEQHLTWEHGPLDTSHEAGIPSVAFDVHDAHILSPALQELPRLLRRDGRWLTIEQTALVARIVSAGAMHRRLGQYVTVTEAADMLGVTDRRVRALIERGQLDAERHGGRWLVRRGSVMDRLEILERTAR